jgi:hypothetical protein
VSWGGAIIGGGGGGGCGRGRGGSAVREYACSLLASVCGGCCKG